MINSAICSPGVSLKQTYKLGKEASTGQSITVTTSAFNLSIPSRRDMNRIIFMHFDESQGELETDNFDALLSINIIRRLSSIQIQTKAAGESWENKEMIPFPGWLLGLLSGLQIRVDVGSSTLEIYINSFHLYSLARQFGNKGVTHVMYEARSAEDQPALGEVLGVHST